MNTRRRRTPEDEDRANAMVLWSVAGLMVLTLAVVAIAAARPAPGASTSAPSARVAQNVLPRPVAARKPARARRQAATENRRTSRAVRTAASQAPAPVSATPKARDAVARRTASVASIARPAATLPESMARRLPSSTQMLVATGAKLGSNTGTFEVYNLVGGHWVRVLRTKANFGKKGLVDGLKRKQGHLNTPTGIWYLGSFVFGQHASAPSGTKMPYRHITRDSWWSSARDATYNTWVQSKSRVSGEHLADSRVQYEYALNTGYNAPPNTRVIGRGTAIFLHCFEPRGNALGKFTHGCIAISRTDMRRVFSLLDPARKPTFAIGTEKRGTATSIWAY